MHKSYEFEQIIVKIYLFDTTIIHENLLPLSFTRPVADFRCGILTIREKWEKYLPGDYDYYPVDYLRDAFGNVENPSEEGIFISGNILPRPEIADFISKLNSGEALMEDEQPLIFRGSLNQWEKGELKAKKSDIEIPRLVYVFDIFLNNGEEIKRDFEILTKGRKSMPLPDCTRMLYSGPQQDKEQSESLVFIEEGAVVECATINVKEGPVYIGKNAVLMEGACIRGPFALCEGAKVRMGAKIYEATTIGPYCKMGGEISNAVIFGYSNKSHDGYLGNAVIGEWCNIGAGTNASNLKNDYSKIRVWNYHTKTFMRTDLQFCGLIMGDHSKIGVNSMINTATVIGVGVNIHGAGFPRTFVPCFSEGSATSGFSTVPLKKFFDTMERVMSRRELKPSEKEIRLLTHIYQQS